MNETRQTQRILVVDDEVGIADIVSAALGLLEATVLVATSGIEALRLIRAEPFDLVVLDVMLPDMDGFEVCHTLRSDGIATPILFLTARTAPADAVRGLTIGADDYVRKPFDLEELVARARALLRRTTTSDPADILRVADVVVNLSTYQATRAGCTLDLTPTEFRVLEVLVRNQRRVLTRGQILDLAWDDPVERDPGAVETVVSRLRRKLDALGPSVVQTRRGVGYGVFEPLP